LAGNTTTNSAAVSQPPTVLVRGSATRPAQVSSAIPLTATMTSGAGNARGTIRRYGSGVTKCSTPAPASSPASAHGDVTDSAWPSRDVRGFIRSIVPDGARIGRMRLPVHPPVDPMLAKTSTELPVGDGVHYEPKWDGFRTIVFRDGDDVELGSRSGKPMTRYFPEVVAAARSELPERCVVDGELVVVRPGRGPGAGRDRLDFDALSQRIHPAASRVRLLAEQTPASFVAFDLLALGDAALLDAPYVRRRALLEQALSDAGPPVHVTPVTTDPDLARRWFDVFEGAGLDGLVCKPAGQPYAPGKRLMTKVKHNRTADVVVAGFRWHTSGPVVGSLLLGLYDDAGVLHHVGVASSFTAARRRQLVEELAPYRDGGAADHPWGAAGSGGRLPGAPSRWSGTKDLSWEPLRPELVAEVGYDHMEDVDSGAPRFRHVAQLKRWRPDREPASCTYAQLDEPVRYDLAAVLSGRSPVDGGAGG